MVGLLAMVASACGSRLPDDTLKALDAGVSRNVTAGNNAAATDESSSASESTDEATSTDSGTSSGASTGSNGNGSSPGAATATTVGGAPAAACTAGGKRNTDVGVTDKEIRVSSIVTDSGPLPGATEGSYRGAASYFAMINSQGGVCGRKLVMQKGDDGLDPAKCRAEFSRLYPKSLAFVSSFGVADSGCVNQIRDSGVPWVALTVDPAGADMRNVYPKGNRDIVDTGPFVYWKQQHPNVKKAGLLFADVGGVSANVPGFRAAIKKAGFDLVHDEGVRVTDPDYTGIIRNLQSEGVEFLYLFAFEVNMHVRFARNMKQQGYNPPVKAANIAFNTRFSELLGNDGDGWENHQTFLPFLDPAEKSRSKALADFIDWNNRVYPGGQLDLFPVNGWGYAALFVDALKQMGPNVTRKGLIDTLYKLQKYDVGGIGTTINPSTGAGEGCFMIAKHVNGVWKRSFPASGGYECNIGENLKFR